MKFEELLLLQPTEGRRRRLALEEEEVVELQEMLFGELRLNNRLRWAINAPPPPPLLSSQLPFRVQVLLTELAMVEEEIAWLEHKLRKLFRKERKMCNVKNPPFVAVKERKKSTSGTSFDLELNLTTTRPLASTSFNEKMVDPPQRHTQSARFPTCSDAHSHNSRRSKQNLRPTCVGTRNGRVVI